ncbi:hypothetical protein GCM10018962_30490 [Dactylosporangium matsuzakiense]|uniref:Uncharacterized protein n=1 Tax=Dactylosporangium matsuzakiense TaxID=53360 RepID=A0A9W6KLQ9_9ACTN|nr:hypothetical protein GCM10017581_043130 [Dactylosporangium matsuzakiense]
MPSTVTAAALNPVAENAAVAAWTAAVTAGGSTASPGKWPRDGAHASSGARSSVSTPATSSRPPGCSVRSARAHSPSAACTTAGSSSGVGATAPSSAAAARSANPASRARSGYAPAPESTVPSPPVSRLAAATLIALRRSPVCGSQQPPNSSARRAADGRDRSRIRAKSDAAAVPATASAERHGAIRRAVRRAVRRVVEGRDRSRLR